MWGIFYRILSVPQNTVMDLNNVMFALRWVIVYDLSNECKELAPWHCNRRQICQATMRVFEVNYLRVKMMVDFWWKTKRDEAVWCLALDVNHGIHNNLQLVTQGFYDFGWSMVLCDYLAAYSLQIIDESSVSTTHNPKVQSRNLTFKKSRFHSVHWAEW